MIPGSQDGKIPLKPSTCCLRLGLQNYKLKQVKAFCSAVKGNRYKKGTTPKHQEVEKGRMGNCFNETDLCTFEMEYCLCMAGSNLILIYTLKLFSCLLGCKVFSLQQGGDKQRGFWIAAQPYTSFLSMGVSGSCISVSQSSFRAQEGNF